VLAAIPGIVYSILHTFQTKSPVSEPFYTATIESTCRDKRSIFTGMHPPAEHNIEFSCAAERKMRSRPTDLQTALTRMKTHSSHNCNDLSAEFRCASITKSCRAVLRHQREDITPKRSELSRWHLTCELSSVPFRYSSQSLLFLSVVSLLSS